MSSAMQNPYILSIFDSLLTVFIWYILDDNFRIYINRRDGDYINAISLPVSTNFLTNCYNIFATHIKLIAIVLENRKILAFILAIFRTL